MLCVKHICFSNNSLIQPHIVGIAVILVEASHSPLAACLLIFLFATPAHRLQRICNGFYITFVHHEACFRSHRLRTATSAICHHWSAARHCLKVGRWKIILISRICKQRRAGIKFRQLVNILRAFNAHDAIRQRLHLLPCQPNEHNVDIRRKLTAQCDEVIKAFSIAPRTRHSKHIVARRLVSSRTKHVGVNAVVNCLHGSPFEKRLFHQFLQPMRHRHKREPVTKRRKQFALQLIIASRPVNEQRTRISPQLRAVMAARLPSVATDEIEVGAMPRKPRSSRAASTPPCSPRAATSGTALHS